MSFEGIKMNDNVVQILKSHGITSLSEIQRRTFPSAANGHDLVGVSQTGSGKTLGFILPIVHQILLSDKPFHTLILSPTRELAQQIAETVSLFSSLGIRHALLTGGEDFNQQASVLGKKPHIVIGTPGRIVRHIEKTKNLHIGRIRKLVFDEADKFTDQDFVQDLEIISKKLKMKNQTLMFTATITDKCKELANQFMRSPKIINVSEDQKVVSTLTESFTLVPEKYKLTVLYNYLLERKGMCSIIVFVELCSNSQKIGLTLAKLGLSCGYLHGKMPQSKRDDIVKRFREKDFSILVATDVAGRGIDIPHVDHVINYDLPDNSKTYTHRIGRTARAGKEGTSLSFVTQYDVEKLQKIEHSLGRQIDVLEYKVYGNYQTVKDVFEEINAEFNQDKTFRR